MSWLPAAASLVASYLVGAFPTAELVGRVHGRDVHREGSGNPGATNTYRVAGAGAAALVGGTDVAKGALATAAGRWQRGPAFGAACGLAAVVGHCFPPRRPGRGGKGVATTAGMVVVLDPALALALTAAWAALAKATRRPSLASIGLAAALPPVALARHRPRPVVAALAAASAIIVVRHGGNIGRLLRGQEGSFTPHSMVSARLSGW